MVLQSLKLLLLILKQNDWILIEWVFLLIVINCELIFALILPFITCTNVTALFFAVHSWREPCLGIRSFVLIVLWIDIFIWIWLLAWTLSFVFILNLLHLLNLIFWLYCLQIRSLIWTRVILLQILWIWECLVLYFLKLGTLIFFQWLLLMLVQELLWIVMFSLQTFPLVWRISFIFIIVSITGFQLFNYILGTHFISEYHVFPFLWWFVSRRFLLFNWKIIIIFGLFLRLFFQ